MSFCIVFVYKAKVREFLKAESKKHVAGFQDRSLQRFFGFRAEYTVLQEAVVASDFDANEVSSVHTSDWTN